MVKVLLSPDLWVGIGYGLVLIEIVRFQIRIAKVETYEEAVEALYHQLRFFRDQFRLNGWMILKMLVIIAVFWTIKLGIYYLGDDLCFGVPHWPWVGVTLEHMWHSWFFIPLLEEIVDRGVILRFVRQRSNLVLGIFLSAAIFALGHSTRSLVPLSAHFIAGVELALIYLWTGSLTPGLIAHAGYNILVNVIW